MTFARAAVLLVVALSASAPAPGAALYPVLLGLGAGAGAISGSGMISHRDRGGSVLRDVRGHCAQGRQRLEGIVAWGQKKLTKEELEMQAQVERIKKFAYSVDQVLGATLTGFLSTFVIGGLFGVATGFKGNGFKGALANGATTGKTWGTLSAAFCGVEVLVREIRGTKDKWNNIWAVGNVGQGAQAMAVGCLQFAAMSYVIDMFVDRPKDEFEQLAQNPSSGDKNIMGMQRK
ncbi:hypothetical protein T484DRAFT_2764899 [Baffinella frigidus]|nr:hypothetical protein T484DRAFT_2764899 [Cryptophyta sp. CCMP2293]